ERRFELRQALSLFRFRDGLVAFERGDLLLDLFGRFSEFLGLRVDAVHDHCDIHRRVFILRETRKATLLGNSPGLRLHLRIRFVGIRAVVELRHILGGGHEALNMLLGELDLLYLLRNGRAGMKQSESQKRGEQRTEKASTRRRGVSLSNERHGLGLYLDTSQGHDAAELQRCGASLQLQSVLARVSGFPSRRHSWRMAPCGLARSAPCVGVRFSLCQNASVHIHGITGEAFTTTLTGSRARVMTLQARRGPTAPKSYSLTADQSWGSYSVPAPTEQLENLER